MTGHMEWWSGREYSQRADMLYIVILVVVVVVVVVAAVVVASGNPQTRSRHFPRSRFTKDKVSFFHGQIDSIQFNNNSKLIGLHICVAPFDDALVS